MNFEPISTGDYVVLDIKTVTSSLQLTSIGQIAIVDSAGVTLLDTYVKPAWSIESGSITNEMVEAAPYWSQILPQIQEIIESRHVVIYNVREKVKTMRQQGNFSDVSFAQLQERVTFHCAAEAFAEIYGLVDDTGRQPFVFRPLVAAVKYYDIPIPSADSALSDCLMTLSVTKAMLANPTANEPFFICPRCGNETDLQPLDNGCEFCVDTDEDYDEVEDDYDDIPY